MPFLNAISFEARRLKGTKHPGVTFALIAAVIALESSALTSNPSPLVDVLSVLSEIFCGQKDGILTLALLF
jgi:hypothetical protein